MGDFDVTFFESILNNLEKKNKNLLNKTSLVGNSKVPITPFSLFQEKRWLAAGLEVRYVEYTGKNS